jgi:hypothetical protein
VSVNSPRRKSRDATPVETKDPVVPFNEITPEFTGFRMKDVISKFSSNNSTALAKTHVFYQSADLFDVSSSWKLNVMGM